MYEIFTIARTLIIGWFGAVALTVVMAVGIVLLPFALAIEGCVRIYQRQLAKAHSIFSSRRPR